MKRHIWLKLGESGQQQSQQQVRNEFSKRFRKQKQHEITLIFDASFGVSVFAICLASYAVCQFVSASVSQSFNQSISAKQFNPHFIQFIRRIMSSILPTAAAASDYLSNNIIIIMIFLGHG